jgi:glycosyltransferase involved in cell wall biosynthesis
MPVSARPRAVYLTDTMADVRNIEALASTFEVTLVAPSFLKDAELTNYWPPRSAQPVARTRLGGGRLVFILRAAVWLRRSRRTVDVVFALDNLTAALAASVARFIGGPPVIVQVGRPTAEYLRCKGAAEPAWKNRARRLFGGALIAINERSAAGIGAVSDYCAAQCRRHNANVRSIPWCGVDTEVFAPRWTKREAREHLGLPIDQPIVMLRSRIAPEKDPETFVRAIDRLRRDGRDVCAVYMGGEHAAFAAVAAAHGVDAIARRPDSLDEIPMWYVAADVDVQTSHAEGLGVSPLESLACGTPVVVTDVGGLPEVVDGGRVGKLVPRGDVEALASAIAAYLDDSALASRHAQLGRAWVQQRFSQEQTWRAWGELGLSVSRRRAPRTKVLFVDHEPRLSGGELDLVDLVRALGPTRTEVVVALPGPGPLADALHEAGATVEMVEMGAALRRVSRWELGRSPLAALRHLASSAVASVRIAQCARRVRPDVIHTNSMKAHVLAIPAAWIVRAPLVWHVRDILEEGGVVGRAFAAVAAVVPARVLCISRAVERPLTRATARGRTRVVYNGILAAPVDFDSVMKARECMGGPDAKRVVGIVGQIARWKGQDVFVEAAARIAGSDPSARFAIVGECLFPENEKQFEEAVRARSSEPALDGRVVWTGAIAPIEPVMAALDVLVHASRLPEPFGRVIIEAMAQGTPVVTTSIGAGSELVTPETGRIVPPGDAGALAVAITELLASLRLPEAAAAYADQCRKRAGEFGIAATANGVLDVYRELGVLGDQDPGGFSATMHTE